MTPGSSCWINYLKVKDKTIRLVEENVENNLPLGEGILL